MSTYSIDCKIVKDFNNLMANTFEVPINTITPNAKIATLGADEYNTFLLMEALEQKYGISFEEKELAQVNDLLSDYYDRTVQEFHGVLVPILCMSKFQNVKKA